MTRRVSIPRGRFALLFAVMLVAAAGNTAMQSLMPSIGRQLHLPDLWIAAAFSLSACIWVLAAPFWARRADRRGRRALMRLGLYGFIGSMLVCGIALAAGLIGLIDSITVFLALVAGRCLYGSFGSAAPPAVQAYIAARTQGQERTNALSMIASSFGLGTVLGPAIAPLFILPPLGLSGPMIMFALVGTAVLVAIITRLPDDTPLLSARGQIANYPAIGGMSSDAPSADDSDPTPLRWRDPRISVWLRIGAIGGHAQAGLLGVIGFLVIDALSVPPSEAPQWIAIVLMGGAAASLLAQWGLIPRLGLDPRRLVIWGCLLSAVGAALTGLSTGMYGITLGFGLASLGFGFFRPGFTSGASLAVGRTEQNAAAGMVTSVIGFVFIAGPALTVALYGLSRPLPFIAIAILMTGLAMWVWLRVIPSDRAG